MTPKQHARAGWIICLLAYATAICLALILGGCGSMQFASASARNTQIGMTALMAVDTAQTVTIAKNPMYLYEGNPLAAKIYGTETPSPKQVVLTNAVYMTGHWMLGSYLDRNAERSVDLSLTAEEDLARKKRFRIMRAIYQGLTILGHGAAVGNNYNQGIRPFASYHAEDQ